MSERLRIVGIFLGGLALGGGLVYLAPEAPPDPAPTRPPPGQTATPPTPLPDGGPKGPPLPADAPLPKGPPLPADAESPGPPQDGAAPAGPSPDDAPPKGPPLDAAHDGPKGPPLGAPDDGPKGPPLGGGAAMPDGVASDWLEAHLAAAPAFWQDRAAAAAGPEAPLAGRMRALAARDVSGPDGRPPPRPQVALLHAEELRLADALRDAGADMAPYDAALKDLRAFE